METSQNEAFEGFVRECRRNLAGIARATKGEHETADVTAEAWLLAGQLEARKGVRADFADPAYRHLLLSHLYQHLVRYTELNVRHAVRLDHAPAGATDADAGHPLLRRLSSDESQEPVNQLMALETASLQEPEPDCHQSLASAYVHLLRRFDNRMADVADHLLISLSYCYRRCAAARWLAVQQKPIPLAVRGRAGKSFVPGHWRAFRLQRAPLQLAFDFGDEFAGRPALWCEP